MVTGVNANMPAGGVTVGATPPAPHVPQEAVQPTMAQTTTAAAAAASVVTTTTPTTVVQTASPTPAAATVPRRSSENRRSNKPIMEKRRRARINNCLNDLKALLLDAMKKDPARHSKLEKADILEMTVKHFETLQRQQAALASATDPSVLNKFRAGFSECASEVGRFAGLEASVKRRLLAHLASCMSASADGNGQPGSQHTVQPSPATTTTQLQVHILPQVDAAPTIQVQQSNGIVYMNANGTALQLVPTRLPNGNIALVAAGAKSSPISSSPISTPSSSPAPSSPLPTLIPIPQRTASTASASSSASSTSSTSTSAASPIAFEAPPSDFNDRSQSPVAYTTVSHRDVATSPASGYTSDPEFDPRVYSPPLQKPLSLVMRKSVIKEAIDEKCWRPW